MAVRIQITEGSLNSPFSFKRKWLKVFNTSDLWRGEMEELEAITLTSELMDRVYDEIRSNQGEENEQEGKKEEL